MTNTVAVKYGDWGEVLWVSNLGWTGPSYEWSERSAIGITFLFIALAFGTVLILAYAGSKKDTRAGTGGKEAL